MTIFREDLDERKFEAEQMFQLVREVAGLEDGVAKASILKSAFVLVLYNMIESTAYLVFETIHERISTRHYVELASDMRKVWVDFFFSSHPSGRHHEHLEKTLEKQLAFPSLDKFMDRIRLFSGNLDARKIDEVLAKYGMGCLTSPGKEKLLVIKNRRNAVAHGEKMFRKACSDLSDSDLEQLKVATFAAMDNLVSHADAYLEQKKYLRQ